MVLLTGCSASNESVEGRASRLEAALKTKNSEEVVALLQAIPAESRAVVIENISFESLKQYGVELASALEALDVRWRFDMKGFSIDYLKQIEAINSLEEANIVEAVEPITIIQACKTDKDVIKLYIDQLNIEGVNPKEDMFVKQGSISMSWQYQKGAAHISKLDMISYNIVNKSFYQITYQENSLTIKPLETLSINYNDYSLLELSHMDHLQALLPLIPTITAPIKLTLTTYKPEDEGTYVGLPMAYSIDGIYQIAKQQPLKKSVGKLEIVWNPALETPPQVGALQKINYHLGIPLEIQNEE